MPANFEARRQALLDELAAQTAAVTAATPETANLLDLDTAACHLAEVHAFGSCARSDRRR